MKSRLHQKNLPPPPQNWHQLQHHPHWNGFTAAARAEFSSLELQGTFRDINQSENKTRPIPIKRVFTYKFDDDFFRKYKARLVIRGDLQIPTEKDTYAAKLAVRLYRVALAIASYFNLEFDDEVLIHYPEGFKKPGRLLRVLKALKALYGLSVSPRLWYNYLSKTLEKLGLKYVPGSGYIFTNEKLIDYFYVDDIVLFYHMSHREVFQELKNTLLEVYTIRYLGELKWFLGLRIIRDRDLRKCGLFKTNILKKRPGNSND
ncbi:hypothetical protein EV44_g3389 [Erysiphe necator]|uniref:Reverse transcriptase Ty1/copia-type domain-containing protein n=1 Tax=Uncinula necator TaxID=52586 RepID=A0A0B1P4U2_UNCNE|nr:hypothetical protein EV44_g3389 [Erysiphe necator]